jgi:broad specificity phosphatase PhoE
MRLILVRHSIRKDNGNTDCSISTDGIKLIDDRAHDILKYIDDPNVIFLSSPFRRTIETAMCLCTNFSTNWLPKLSKFDQSDKCTTVFEVPDIVVEPLLHETMFNRWMDINIPKPVIMYSRASSDKLKNSGRYETWSDIVLRCKKFLDKVIKRNQKITLAITHGGIINAVLLSIDATYVFDMKQSNPAKYIPGYLDYVVLEYESEKWRVAYRSF